MHQVYPTQQSTVGDTLLSDQLPRVCIITPKDFEQISEPSGVSLMQILERQFPHGHHSRGAREFVASYSIVRDR